MMNDSWRAPLGTRGSKSCPCSPLKPLNRTRPESSHVTHKVPAGDTPYVKAKRVQLVDKDPERAIALFWAAINSGDRVDSALKDMAIVMKQANRAEEAIEAIKSLRNRCSDQAQESLDNILLDLYKRCGRLDDQISLLKHKLYLIHQGMAFNGKQTKTARSQGKKFQVSVEQETTRLLGNLGWAFMQQQNYIEAESAYRKALLIASDNNKMCNLGICLMKQGRVAEAKETLQRVKPAMVDGPRGVDSHLKAYERAQEMLRDLESKSINGHDRFLEAFLGSSSIWQPQPCAPFSSDNAGFKDSFNPSGQRGENFADENFNINTMNRMGLDNLRCKDSINPSFDLGLPDLSYLENQYEDFADENFSVNIMARRALTDNRALPPLQKSTKLGGVLSVNNSLNIDAPPFYSKLSKNQIDDAFPGPLCKLKRTRSVTSDIIAVQEKEKMAKPISEDAEHHQENGENLIDCLPDSEEFEEMFIAAAIAPFVAPQKNPVGCQRNIEKRLKSFQDITLPLSPKI